MPVILHNDLPAYTRLADENVFVMSPDRVCTQVIRPLKILVLNLMPTKITTETQIATHRGTHVSSDHLDLFYKTFNEVKDERFDGMIITGHPEYDLLTLDAEYRRDVERGLPIAGPENYYPGDDPAARPVFSWRSHAHLLYQNWLNYYVYQATPYDLDELASLAGS